MNLVEKYQDRLQFADKVHAASHEGRRMNESKKLLLARLLENTNKYLTEAFDYASGTQRADMGNYKKFCLALTNVAIPNLIAPDLK